MPATPVMRSTRLSRKLNLRPVKVFELPKLTPHLAEGRSRLWAMRDGKAGE